MSDQQTDIEHIQQTVDEAIRLGQELMEERKNHVHESEHGPVDCAITAID